jgi:hypothetical protein
MIARAYFNSFKMCSTSLRLQGLSSITFASNVGGMIFVRSLHGICMGYVVICHGRMFTSWRIIRLLLWIFISFQTPYIFVALFPTPVALYLFPSLSLLCELCTRSLLHLVLIFLLFFCLCFLIFFRFSKAHMCYIKLCDHLIFLFAIQLHHQQLCFI